MRRVSRVRLRQIKQCAQLRQEHHIISAFRSAFVPAPAFYEFIDCHVHPSDIARPMPASEAGSSIADPPADKDGSTDAGIAVRSTQWQARWSTK